MPVTIGGLQLEFLSGPVSFDVLIPKNEKFPKIMLLGDVHEVKIQETCSNAQVTGVNISTITPAWYRLLDSLGIRIDYFVETFFEPSLINDPYYIKDDVYSSLLMSNNQQVMSWIARNYIPCFSELGSNKCITSNIKYHFADIRLGHASSNQDLSYKTHQPIYFESYLHKHFENICDNHMLIVYKNKSISELLLIALDKPREFAKFIYDTSDQMFVKNSLIHKEVIKAGGNTEEWINFFVEYYTIYLNNVIIENINIIKEYFRVLSNNLLQSVPNNYKKIFHTAAIQVLSPLLDIYFIFRSIRKSKNISILSAGWRHTSSIKFILEKMGVYTTVYSDSTNLQKDKELQMHNLNFNHELYRCLKLQKLLDLNTLLNVNPIVHRNRVKCFGLPRYIDILNGSPITVNEIETIMIKYKKNIQETTHMLKLKSKVIFEEQENKYLI